MNGIIEIIVPYETCNAQSIYHQKQFNVRTFFSYVINGNYKNTHAPVRIKKIKFHTRPLTLRSFLWSPIHLPSTIFFIGLFNLLIKLKYDLVDQSVLKIFAQGDFYLRVKYEKTFEIGGTFLERLAFKLRR